LRPAHLAAQPLESRACVSVARSTGPKMLCCGGGGGDDVEGGGGGNQPQFTEIEKKGWEVKRGKALGEGGFGTVHLCTRKGGQQEERACKAMRLANSMDRQDFRQEVDILKRIKTHKNICHFVDWADDARYGYLVMQSCSGGELFDQIAARKCTEKDSALAVVDVLSALNFLASKRILHRDLKPENLLYKDKSPGAPLKLIDFGLAMYLAKGQAATEVCGTTSYMAPEVLQGQYQFECDVWSLGVITYFLLCGSLPFPGNNDDEKENRILRSGETGIPMSSKAWASVSPQAKDFVKQVLHANPRKRLSGKAALKHPWIAERGTLSEAPLSEEVASSLKKYAGSTRFAKAVRHQMATQLTSSELHYLRNVFERLDTDGTGTVSREEFMAAIKDEEQGGNVSISNTLKEIDMDAFDLDGDGQIDWKEFVAGAINEHEVFNEESLYTVFQKADTDNNGTLSHSEIESYLGKDHELTRELMEEIKKSRGADVDIKDLKITLAEFNQLIKPSGTTEGKRKKRVAKDPSKANLAPQPSSPEGEDIQRL